MTPANLKGLSLKDLTQLAKRKGIRGWEGMRREQLLKALLTGKHMANGKVAAKAAKASPASRMKSPKAKSTAAKPKVAAHAKHPVRAKATSQAATPAAKAPANKKLTLRAATAPRAQVKVALKPIAKVAATKVTATKIMVAKAPAPKPVVAAKAAAAKVVAPKPVAKTPPPKPAPPKNPHVVRKIVQAKAEQRRLKNLSFAHPADKPDGFTKDRLVVMVRDAYWLHAYWEISRHGVTRAEAALGQEWHAARPVLRLLDVSSNSTTSAAEMVVRDIEIHGGVNNWYIEVTDPPRSYRVDIGYLSASGKFFTLARSNVVSTPKAGASSSLDENWTDVAENFDKIYAMSGGYTAESVNELQELFEERLRRPMGSPMMTRYGASADGFVGVARKKEFKFELDAELLVFGSTEPNAHVMLQGEPVQLRPDGSFTVRIAMPNARQVIPAVASSADGIEQRTVVLAVERNTKVMEPVTRDSND